MAMVVQHNLTAMNSNRMLGLTTGYQKKSAEKLASGYQINRAADNAAGLSISEKMRSQIRGLDRASTNAQDGVSLIQTAEGALNEAHAILQRMHELAVQGANDTNENIDREAIDKELNQLTDELDRISTTTQFNKMNLLDGSFQSKNLHVGANVNQKIAISIGNMNSQTLGLRGVDVITEQETQTGNAPVRIQYLGQSVAYDAKKTQASNISAAVDTLQAKLAGSVNNFTYAQQYDNGTGSVYFVGYYKDSNVRYGTSASVKVADKSAISIAVSADLKDTTKFKGYLSLSATSGKGTAEAANKGNVSVKNYTTANNSLAAIQSAINKVSDQRSALGAIQNRLEHTIANLDNVHENTQAAESRLRDTDMASEMVNYSKFNILAQAGTSMLAQANASNQNVLSLLG